MSDGVSFSIGIVATWMLFSPTATAQTDSGRPSANRPVEKLDGHRVGPAIVDEQGIRAHAVESTLQSGPTKIRVLTPREMPVGKRFPVLYLLPVQAGEERRYGDGLVAAQRLGLADQYGVICVAPTFSQLPWYADHPTNPKLKQESYLLEVVLPAVERFYPTVEQPAGRLLVGFSKSGWGAFSLLLRHPDIFGRAGAWDSPWSMDWPTKYGSQEIFGTPENFAAYRIYSLFQLQAPLLQDTQRLVLAGHGNFRAETEAAHNKLNELGIQHTYLNGPERKHDWHSGWLAEVGAALIVR